MTPDAAKKIVGDLCESETGDALPDLEVWAMYVGSDQIQLDGTFKADQLEAIAVLMRERRRT